MGKSSNFVGKVQAVTTTEAQALAVNPFRRYLCVFNSTANPIRLSFEAGNAPYIEIPAGQGYDPDVVPLNAIYVKATTGTGNVQVIEG